MQSFQIELDTSSWANILGCLALAAYILTLLPTILRIVFPRSKETGIPQWLLKYRRLMGILAFCLTLGHALLVVKKRNFDGLDPKTYWIYFKGVTTLTIFTLLTITSNDWSIKKLKKNWKKLHQLTYVAMFLLIWHVWETMSGQWTYLTPIEMVAITGINVLFLIRMWIERQKRQKNQAKKDSTELA